VSQENVKVVRRGNDLLNRGDWSALAKLYGPQVEFRDLRSAVDTPQVLHGARAIESLLAEWTEAFSMFGAEILDCIDADPWVICDVRWYGTGREAQVPVDVRQADAYELHEGKIVRATLGYDDVAAAKAALGPKE
jgi:ketosteroid isomerase-like protein